PLKRVPRPHRRKSGGRSSSISTSRCSCRCSWRRWTRRCSPPRRRRSRRRSAACATARGSWSAISLLRRPSCRCTGAWPICAVAAWRLLQLPRGMAHERPAPKADVAGHILFAIGAVSALFWFTSVSHRFPFQSAPSLALVAIAVFSLSALVWHERRHPSPFLPVDLLGERTIGLSSVVVLVFAA